MSHSISEKAELAIAVTKLWFGASQTLLGAN